MHTEKTPLHFLTQLQADTSKAQDTTQEFISIKKITHILSFGVQVLVLHHNCFCLLNKQTNQGHFELTNQ